MIDEEGSAGLVAAVAEGADAVIARARHRNEAWRRAGAKEVISGCVRLLDDDPRFSTAAASAILAVATMEEARRCHLLDAPAAFTLEAVQVLIDRRPAWLARWVDVALERRRSRWSYVPVWAWARRLVRSGTIDRPGTADYTLGMIHGIRDLRSEVTNPIGERVTLREILTHDRGLLDDEVWRLFQVEGRPRPAASLTTSGRPWAHALLSMSADGEIPRGRLIDETLGALASGFSAYNNRWYVDLYRRLELSDDEVRQRRSPLIALLHQPDATVVSLAIGDLHPFVVSGEVPVDDVATALNPAIVSLPKATAIPALRMIEAGTKTQAAPPTIAVQRAVAAALRHPASDVQAAALALLEGIEVLDSAVVGDLSDVANTVVAPLRGRVGALGELPTVDGRTQPPSFDDLVARAAAVPEVFAQAAHVHEAFTHVSDGRLPPALLPDRRTAPPDPDAAVTPVADIAELLEVWIGLIEDAGDPVEIERGIDGLARLGALPNTALEARVGPLLKRAGNPRRFGNRNRPTERLLGQAVLAWFGQGELGQPMSYAELRLSDVVSRVRAGDRVQLLSAPTSRGGFVAADVLVDRLTARRLAGSAVDGSDAVFALLRMLPVGAELALAKARRLDGELAAAVRYALGDAVDIGESVPLWAAASRARHPYDTDPAMAARHPGLGPDVAEPARIAWTVVERRYERRYFALACEPPIPDPPVAGLVAQEPLFFNGRGDWQRAPFTVRWAAGTWPVNRAGYYASGLATVEPDLEAYEGWRNYLEPLLDADERVAPIAVTLIAVGLSAGSPTTRRLATDVVIEAAADGRLAGPELGDALARLLRERIVKPSRVAAALDDVGRVSLLHGELVRSALERAVAAAPAPASVHALLEVLVEHSLPNSRPVTNAATREALASFSNGSKSGRLAKVLLAIPAAADAPQPEARLALLARIERAERWAAWAASG